MAAPLCIHTRNFGPRVFSRVKSFSRPESVENFNEPLIQNVHVKIKKEKISDAIVFCFILFNVLKPSQTIMSFIWFVCACLLFSQVHSAYM